MPREDHAKNPLEANGDMAARTTVLLRKVRDGDHHAADELFTLLYNEIHQLAERYLRGERRGHTLQPTALVHEVYLRLINQKDVDFQGHTHFLATAAQAMRRVLVDHARSRRRLKRGGAAQRVPLTVDIAVQDQRAEDVLVVEEALTKLEEADRRQATIVEMRYFGGLSIAEVAEALGISKRAVERDWAMARAWLRRELHPSESS
jgi:RNA polymerase sigma-70 factor (ECF subfamily)